MNAHTALRALGIGVTGPLALGAPMLAGTTGSWRWLWVSFSVSAISITVFGYCLQTLEVPQE